MKDSRCKKHKSHIPEDFDPEKYAFKDDFSLWMSALSRRVALRSEVEEILKWRNSGREHSAQSLALNAAWQARCKKKIEALIEEPIPVRNDDFFKYIINGSKLEDREGYLTQHQPISDRLVLDEIRSANKLQDHFLRNIFDQEVEKLAKDMANQPIQEQFGMLLKPFREESLDITAKARFNASYKMWQADMQMPDFSGEFGLKVNLLYDDETLRNSFSEWLQKTRSLANFPVAARRKVNENILQEWQRMRVLPYIDLWLYQDAFDVRFSWREIGERLYGGESEGNRGKDYEKRAKDAQKRAIDITKPSVFFSLCYRE